MKIVVTGTRGIPDILGGVETHCEELFPRIAEMGHEVVVIRRSCYVSGNNKIQSFRGVLLKDIYAPHRKSLEAIVHTFLSVLEAKRLHADILHVHAVGPSLVIPFARLLGLKVVMTHHGPDYDRAKWGILAKLALRMGERNGAKWSNEVIVISQVIKDILLKKYNRSSHLIFNGVNVPVKSQRADYVESLGLLPGKYVVAVGRFVKEKGFDLLIEAFCKASLPDCKLVIAGDADHEDEYSLSLKALARQHGVALAGFIKGEKLNQLLSNAGLFVLPSFHEGLPISLLEAMSYNLDVLVSDIPANRLPELGKGDFFACGDCNSLSDALARKWRGRQRCRQYNLTAYDWNHIARQTEQVYRSVLGKV